MEFAIETRRSQRDATVFFQDLGSGIKVYDWKTADNVVAMTEELG